MIKEFFSVLFFGLSFVCAVDEISVSVNSASSHGFASSLNIPGLTHHCKPDERCVPYYNCIDTDGAGIFNIRTNTADVKYLTCEDSLRICCEIDNIQEVLPKFSIADSCGFRNVDGLGHFAHGNFGEAQFGEFPWMMAILKKVTVDSKTVNVYTAGGSLIHTSVVLTTAHNLNNTNPNDIVIRGGEWNTQSQSEMLKHQERNVAGITYHESFNRANLQNDLALIFLEKPFGITPHINTICLPQVEYQNVGKRCLVSGWGRSKFGSKENYQVFLKKVEVPVVASDVCEAALRKTRLGEDFQLHDGFMCAGGVEGIDACTGDGGSPLVCAINDNDEYYYYQAGIVVGGIGCGQNVPAFYVDVQKYLPWIKNQMNLKGFN